MNVNKIKPIVNTSLFISLPSRLLEISLKSFGPRAHHGKDEETLFLLVEQRGIPREGGPTGLMRMEHEQGRNFVKALAEAVERYERGDENAKAAIIENSRDYTQLLAQHISKEDDILYSSADKILSSSDQKELLEKFEKVEKKESEKENTASIYVW